jgi:hypothetical protein
MDNNNDRTVKPWDLINPNKSKVESHVQQARLSICEACPKLIRLTKTCIECGCFMVLKTKLEEATCPLGKW